MPLHYLINKIKREIKKNIRVQAYHNTDLTNLEDLLEYIQPFTHLFNKKKFEKLLKIRE